MAHTPRQSVTLESCARYAVSAVGCGMIAGLAIVESMDRFRRGEQTPSAVVYGLTGCFCVLLSLAAARDAVKTAVVIYLNRYGDAVQFLLQKSGNGRRDSAVPLWIVLLAEELGFIVGIGGVIYITSLRNGDTPLAVRQVVATSIVMMQCLPLGHCFARYGRRLVGQVLAYAGIAAVGFWLVIAVGTVFDALNFHSANPLELGLVSSAVMVGAACVPVAMFLIRVHRLSGRDLQETGEDPCQG